MKLNKKGFTLVELLVAIAIIALVLAFSIFGIVNVINNSKEKTKKITESSIKEAANIYSSESDNSSWKKNNDYDAFCVTVGELMNKGFLDKNSIIENKDIKKDTYVIVKRNNVTFSTISEEIVPDIIGNEYNKICTGQSSSGETLGAPTISNSTNYTNMLNIPFSTGSATSGIKNYKCLYGESSSNINKEATIENNTCIINNLKHNNDYYVLIYMNTNDGSSILAEGNRNYTTSDFNKTTFNQNKNEITITYNNKDTNGNNINNPSYYFTSDIEGTLNAEVEACVLKNNIFTCSGKTKKVEKNTWYKVFNTSVKITYPEENNEVNIDTRIYDGSNNYRSDNNKFTIKKYIVKFYKNTALNIDGNTGTYIEKYCIASGNNKCSITSPNITAQIGYSAVGWNTSVNATTSSWNINTSKEINSNANYYAITKVNQYTYNIIYKSNSGKQLGTATITKNYGTTNTVTPKSFTGYTSPSSQSITWDSTTAQTITFTYTPITYTITYNLNGGSVTGNPTSYTIESNAITLNNPTKTGYTFTGWTGSNGTTATKTVTIATGSTGNKTYTSNWSSNSYTYNIVYKSSTGKELGTSTATYNYGTTNTITPKSFTGYTSPSSQTIKWDSTTAKTITFTYTPITYTITYNLNGGSVSSNPTTYTIESSAITLNNPTKTGYTFTGWTGSNGTTATKTVTIATGSTGNKTYTSNWSSNSYTYNIVYKSSTGKELGIDTITYNYGTENTISPKSFTGYTSPSSQTIKWDSTTAKTITFTYTPTTYTITYNLNGGSVTGNPTTYTIESSAITLKNPTKTGYTFAGWTGSNVTTATKTVTIATGSTGNKTYTATWNSESYTYNIEYKSISGLELGTDTITYNYGTENTISPKSFTGYTSPSSQTIKWDSTTAKTITFIYEPIKYKITYSIDVSGNRKEYTIETETFTINDPSMTGYTFAGWTGSNGTTPQTTVTIPKGSMGDKTYTANWTLITYTITYNLNGGSVSPVNPSSYTVQTSTFTLNNPTKTGYTFAGWTGSNGTTPSKSITITKGSTGVREYTANWTASTYTITYNANGGTNAPSPQTETIGTPITLTSEIPTNYSDKQYKAFMYWIDSSGNKYYPDSSYSGSESITLYAQWHTHTWNAIGNTLFGTSGQFSCGYNHTQGYMIYCSGCGMSARHYNEVVLEREGKKGNADYKISPMSCPCTTITAKTYFDDKETFNSTYSDDYSKVTAVAGEYGEYPGKITLTTQSSKPAQVCNDHKVTISVSNTAGGSTYSGGWTNKTVISTISYHPQNDQNPAIDTGTLKYKYNNGSWNTISNAYASSHTIEFPPPSSSEGTRNTTVTIEICDSEWTYRESCTTTSFALKQYVDSTVPTCSFTSIEKSNGDIVLTVTGSDKESGLADAPYWWTDFDSGYGTSNTKTFDYSEMSGIEVKVKDKTGNVGSCIFD